MSLLDRIGRGMVSFGTGIPQIDLDTREAENRNLGATARINEVNAQLAEQSIDPATIAAQEAEQRQMQQLQQQAAQGNEAAMIRLVGLDPELANGMLEASGIIDERKANEFNNFADAFFAAGDNVALQDMAIRKRINDVTEAGGIPKESAELLAMSPEERSAAMRVMQAATGAVFDPQIRDDASGVPRYVDGPNAGQEVFSGDAARSHSLKLDERINDTVKQNLETEEGLRKEVNTLLKDFYQVADANARVVAAGNNPSPAGDLALIFNYMKMLDPGSTVREGEFATAEQSGSIPTRVVARYNKIMAGERLSGDQRKDFLDRASSLFTAAQSEAVKTATAYENIATTAGVNPANVIAVFNQRNANIPQAAQADPQGQDSTLQDARDAISRGADRAAVIQRLQKLGIDSSML